MLKSRTPREQQRLDKALNLLDEDKAKAALGLLDRLSRERANDVEVIATRARALSHMDRLDEALANMERALALAPNDPQLWIDRAYLYTDPEQVLAALAEGAARCPDPGEILEQQATQLQQLGRTDEAFTLLERMLDQGSDPARIYRLRADWLVSRAEQPAEGAETVTNLYGVTFAVADLEAALADYTRAVEADPAAPGPYLRRAECCKHLQRFEEAEADIDRALETMDPDDPARAFLIETRRDSDGGPGAREKLVQVMREAVDEDTGGGPRSVGQRLAGDAVEAVIARIEGGGPLDEAIDTFMREEPTQMQAISIARQLYFLATEPEADLQPCPAQRFPKPMRRFCDQAQRQLEAAGFRVIGDFEPVHLRPQLACPTLLRLFLSDDGRVAAAAFHIIPPRPDGLLARILGWATGPLRRRGNIDLESELTDGRFLVTNNSAYMDPFDYGPRVTVIKTRAGTPARQALAIHREHLARLTAQPDTQADTQADTQVDTQAAVQAVPLADMPDILAMQERLRQAKTSHRRTIGYATESELRAILGKHYARLADSVRDALNAMTKAPG